MLIDEQCDNNNLKCSYILRICERREHKKVNIAQLRLSASETLSTC